MDPSLDPAFHRSLEKAIKWVLFLLLIKAKNPLQLTAFFAANPLARALLKGRFRGDLKKSRHLDKLSNAIPVAFLYGATAGNPKIPKDYVSLYLCERYFGTLNPPSSELTVSPSTAPYFKLDSYPPWVKRLYRNKHIVIFPLIYGQILSNYLTPTKYKLNQRYLSSSLKRYLLDPIWINFRMGVNFQSISWPGLMAAYVKHNAYLALYMMVANLRPQITSSWRDPRELKAAIARYLTYCLHKSNSIVNFLYKPSLLSMLILSLTSPMLTRVPAIQKFYMANMKSVTKNYIKLIAFVSALLTIYTQNMSLLSSPQSGSSSTHDENAPRELSVGLYNGINMYFLRLIVLSKWRILKENHPWFTIMKVGTWQRIEAVSMCFLVWKLMNLNDYINVNSVGQLRSHCQQLRSDLLMRIMQRVGH